MVKVPEMLILAALIAFYYWHDHSHFADGHRILMLPISMSSHQMYFGKLGQGLSELGHRVEMLSPSSARIPEGLAGGNFTISTYPVHNRASIFDSPETSIRYMDYASSRNTFAWLEFFDWMKRDIFPAVDSECESLLDNLPLVERIVNRSRFEFVILDVMSTDCYYEVVRAAKLPYGVFGIPFMTWHSGVPRLPSFVPNYASEMSDSMTFLQRWQTFTREILQLFLLKFAPRRDFRRSYRGINKNDDDDNGARRGFFDIVREADLQFYLEDPVIGYPRPNMPNVVSVGDVMAGIPGSKLSAELDSFLGNSSSVLFSLGSYLRVASEDVASKYCRAFQELRQVKVIWKLGDSGVCERHLERKLENVLVLPWIPQNDLLADERIKVFITHGGLNSMMESIYHAKPVVVFPLAIDQRFQAGSAHAKRHGIQMDMSDWDSLDLVRKVEEILRDPLYAREAKLYSDMLRSRKDSPAKRASEAIDFVLRFGRRRLRSASLDLYWFQLFMFDICLATVALVATLSSICYCCCFRLVKRLSGLGKYKLKAS